MIVLFTFASGYGDRGDSKKLQDVDDIEFEVVVCSDPKAESLAFIGEVIWRTRAGFWEPFIIGGTAPEPQEALQKLLVASALALEVFKDHSYFTPKVEDKFEKLPGGGRVNTQPNELES
ncbi:uncharacterized protein LTR77_006800 [Saxophila tyrrhenica]|uniref:Uncharacterized protein n=1 Tax=Saxophila tyrrhenica TaxID=1690608 RepID=A0AAV9P6E1_9PEZI|nr:hypothetical protein LTR77_006800 [Saxophila tyrrhenica]